MARKRARLPRWTDDPREVRPMLAELADPQRHERILGKTNLVFEPKYDGIRALVDLQVEPSVHVAIYSRAGNDKSDQFPEITAPLEKFAQRLDGPLLLDGEIVALDAKGQPLGFQHLQGRLHVRGLKAHRSSRAESVALIAFDLLRDGDEDLRRLPFTERRDRLVERFKRPGSRALRLIDSTVGGGGALRAKAERAGWEGIIAKDPASRYASGRRHASWQKLKFVETEELVIGGWTEPRQSRSHFGALLLGYYPKDEPDAQDLVFAGQVGSGFSQDELDRVAAKLAPLIRPACPFTDFPRDDKTDHWVEPTLVAQTKFTEWTLDGLLRNPVYLGLRTDKKATDVRLPRRRPSETRAATEVSPGRHRTKTAKRPRGRTRVETPADVDASAADLLDRLEDLEQRQKRGTLVLSSGARVPGWKPAQGVLARPRHHQGRVRAVLPPDGAVSPAGGR